MPEVPLTKRLRRLPVATVLGHQVRVAVSPWARLLGLAHLDRGQAGAGLLIPRCASVHTFGMRFALDLYFLNAGGAAIDVRLAVRPRRLAFCGHAAAVLEVPAGEGGESAAPSS